EAPDGVQVVEVARCLDGLAVAGLDGGAGQIVGRDVLDVFAPVAVGGEGRGVGLDAARPRLDADRQVVDLVAGVVVVELARDLGALGGEQAADGVAEGGLAGMPHVQRAGRVGGDEFHQHALVGGGAVAV